MPEETTVETTETTETVEVEKNGEAEKVEAKLYPESYVKKLHTENAGRRKREEELAAKLKEYQDKEIEAETDLKKKVEHFEKRAKDVESEYKEKLTASERRYVRAEVRAAAIKAGIIDPDDVNSMDLSDLRVDDDGNVLGVEDLIAAGKERKPHWFKGAKSEEKTEKAERKVVTPPRKSDPSSLDYGALPEDDFRKSLDKLGVKI